MTKLTDYEGFVEKFEPKKTTDDCYTPPNIYDEVVRYVGGLTNLEGREIVRPFYPGGDYEDYDYPDGCVVIDNPPFSIYSKIVRFYLARKIDFFLFAPAMTQMVKGADVCYVVIGKSIIYDNWANIATAFTTNLIKDKRIVVDCDLSQIINQANEENKKTKKLRKIKMPDNFTTLAKLRKLANYGINLSITKKECVPVKKLELAEKDIFGGGFFLTDEVFAKIRPFEIEEIKVDAVIQLSYREEQLIKFLNEQN